MVPFFICRLTFCKREKQMANSNATISSAVMTLIIGMLNKLSPDQWLAFGVFIGIVCTVLSLVFSSYIKLAMRKDAKQADQRRFELLSKCLADSGNKAAIRMLADREEAP